MKKGLKLALMCSTLVLGGALIAGACTSASNSTYTCVRAEDSGEEPLEEEIEEEESVTEWLKNKVVEFKDTILIPVIGGISIASISTLVINFIMNYLRGKKLDEKCQLSESKLAEATLALATIKDIYDTLINGNKLNEETKALINSKMQLISEKIDTATNYVSKVEKIEPVLRLLVQLESKLAKSDPNVVKTGAIKDIEEITNLIKEI